MIRFDMGPLTQGQYTIARDLFHPFWQKLINMNIESDDSTGLVNFVKPVEDVTRFSLRLDPAFFLDFVGHCKQVIQFTKNEGTSSKHRQPMNTTIGVVIP